MNIDISINDTILFFILLKLIIIRSYKSKEKVPHQYKYLKVYGVKQLWKCAMNRKQRHLQCCNHIMPVRGEHFDVLASFTTLWERLPFNTSETTLPSGFSRYIDNCFYIIAKDLPLIFVLIPLELRLSNSLRKPTSTGIPTKKKTQTSQPLMSYIFFSRII